MADRSGPAALVRRLREAAGPSGRLPFDRYLEVVLYDPDHGYYSASRVRLGPEGDFYTAAHVDPLFGDALAERIAAEFVRLGRPRRFRVVEVGPGDGTLAAQVVGGLDRRLPEGSSVEYRLVDRSAAMRERALRRLAAVPAASSVRWRGGASLGADGPFTGVIVANELLDALPFQRWVWSRGAWHQLEVDVAGERFRWVEGAPVPPLPGPAFPRGDDEGTLAEVGLPAGGFVREVADHLVAGSAILLDYGAEEPELVRGHPRGTLSALRAHRVAGDPLANPGETDLSAFVNFTRLRAAARVSGLVELAYRSQSEALGAWGFPALLEAAMRSSPDAESRVRRQLSAKNLLFGFDNFRVLELGARPPSVEHAVDAGPTS